MLSSTWSPRHPVRCGMLQKRSSLLGGTMRWDLHSGALLCAHALYYLSLRRSHMPIRLCCAHMECSHTQTLQYSETVIIDSGKLVSSKSLPRATA